MWQSLKNIYHLIIAFFSNLYYGFPASKLIVIGVTGTDGKTTTTHMIYEILVAAGKKTSMISTVKAIIGGREHDTGFHVTTPDPHVLPSYLKKAVDNGDEYFVLEISSHALDQNRAGFVQFAVGVLTTLTHEHLDYHKTFENYALAKFKLLNGAKKVIVIPQHGIPKNVLHYLDLASTWRQVVTFGLTTGDETQKKWNFKLKIPGDYNIANALAAAAATKTLGISKEVIKKELEQFPGIAGRFEEVALRPPRPFRVIIDFAHKPNALEKVLVTARSQMGGKGRLIVMYGAASERDRLKRPMMGKISGRLADITVLTDEDPRWEDSIAIIDEIASGCKKAGAIDVTAGKKIPNGKHVFFKIPNRRMAIEFILQELAEDNDVVLLCGKGHEKSVNYRGVEEPWDEYEVVKKSFAS